LAGNRFLSFADVTRAAVMQGRRRQWELTAADGSVLTLRTTLDSDELHGGWSALDEVVAFLTRTRMPAPSRDPASDRDHLAAAPASAPPQASGPSKPPAPPTPPPGAPLVPLGASGAAAGPFPSSSSPATGGQPSAIDVPPTSSTPGPRRDPDADDFIRDLATAPTSGGPVPAPAPTSGAS
jgi:hypothetical protein